MANNMGKNAFLSFKIDYCFKYLLEVNQPHVDAQLVTNTVLHQEIL